GARLEEQRLAAGPERRHLALVEHRRSAAAAAGRLGSVPDAGEVRLAVRGSRCGTGGFSRWTAGSSRGLTTGKDRHESERERADAGDDRERRAKIVPHA